MKQKKLFQLRWKRFLTFFLSKICIWPEPLSSSLVLFVANEEFFWKAKDIFSPRKTFALIAAENICNWLWKENFFSTFFFLSLLFCLLLFVSVYKPSSFLLNFLLFPSFCNINLSSNDMRWKMTIFLISQKLFLPNLN